MNEKKRGSVLYISHGGGPLPLLGDASHEEMVDTLKKMPVLIAKPSAIIVISAHWEENQPTVTQAKNPHLLYDYYGFPEESYQIQYPATGDPLLAGKILKLLKNDEFPAVSDNRRGFDHGLFVPLKIMYPAADIPCVQLSLINSLNPLEHIKIGKALAPLIEENILVLGSGFSFHNLQAFFSPSTIESRNRNWRFEESLRATCTSHELSEEERERRLVEWETAPEARYCHPREEHLLPLHVCYGMMGSPAKQMFPFEVMGKMASAYLW
ncbi:MAG: dioxygenase [Candidatus Riflebacteria bacterium]|nr:dioxygenase [Candidatus Riflebacteria bacterium]